MTECGARTTVKGDDRAPGRSVRTDSSAPVERTPPAGPGEQGGGLPYGYVAGTRSPGMTIRTFDGTEPSIHDSARVDPAATVIGDVTIEAEASVWPNAVLRGDSGPIHVHERTNVQDGAILHEGTTLGPSVTVGHNAIVHAATVEENALVGMGATVLDDSTVGERALVAAGSVVTEGTEIPPETLVAGTPASVVKEVPESPWTAAADHYVELANRYEETSDIVE